MTYINLTWGLFFSRCFGPPVWPWPVIIKLRRQGGGLGLWATTTEILIF